VTQQTQIIPAPTGLAPNSTVGMSELKLTAAEKAVLLRPLDRATEVSIRPEGIVYVSVNVIRQRLQEAFGPGEWALRMESIMWDDRQQLAYYDGSLWIRGRFASRAIGGKAWYPTNRGVNKTHVMEGARSDCLKRCCKDLGIGMEVADKTWCAEWACEFAESYIADAKGGKDDGYKMIKKTIWKKKGVPLSEAELSKATAILGCWPFGFSPNTVVIGGEHIGKKLCDVPVAGLDRLATASSQLVWKMAAKAEIYRRQQEEVAAANAAHGVATQQSDTVADILGDEDGEAEISNEEPE
jgi:hypothetical protein